MIKVYKGIKQGSKDPSGFARDEAFDTLRGIILPITIFGALLVILFYLLGYSEFWFGPSGFFKVISVIASIAWVIWFVISRIILMLAKKLLAKAKQKVDTHVFNDVTPKD